MKAYQPETDVTIKLFAYGDPGSGKTTLCASALDDPRTSPVLWFNAQGNPHSIRKRPVQPTMFTIEKPSDIDDPYDWLAAGQPAKHSFVTSAEKLGVTLTPPYKTVILDTATEYQRICMDAIMGWDKKGLGELLAAPEFKQWGQVLGQLTKMARYFYALPLSVVITAQERPDKDERTGTFVYSPGLWGQGRSEVPSYSLLTMRLVRKSKMLSGEKNIKTAEGDDAYSVGYIDQVGSFLAKDQYGDLPKVLPEPTIPAIMKILYGKPTT
jgi:hypothetical protein